MVPEICYLVSFFYRSVFRKLCLSFRTLYVWFFSVVMSAALCILWKKHPSKIAAVLLGLPSFLSAGCFDASPEKSRVLGSWIFLNLCGLAVNFLQWAVVLQILKMLFSPSMGILLRSAQLPWAQLATLSLLVWMNIVSSLLHPDSLVVLQSDIASVKVDSGVVKVLQASQRLLVSEGIRIGEGWPVKRRGNQIWGTALQLASLRFFLKNLEIEYLLGSWS